MVTGAYHAGIANKTSKALWERAREVSPLGAQGDGKYYAPYPHFIRKAEGARLWDADGNEFIDYWNGAGPCVLGHGDKHVTDAVAQATAERGNLYCAPHELEVELCETLENIIPCAGMSIFLNAGSDIMCMAVRVARAVTGRRVLVKFAGSYHGWYDDLLFNVSSYDHPPDNTGRYRPIAESTGLAGDAAEVIRVLDYNDIEAVKALFEQEGSQIAAVVVEPVMHGPTTGSIDPLPDFLQQLRTLCTSYGSLLIFDEILTGFRHHLGGAQTLLGVTPDLAAFGKAIANGFPLAALCGTKEIMRQLSPAGRAFFSGTYNGNVTSVAAALATIERLRDGAVFSHIWDLGSHMRDRLNAVFHSRAVVGNARSYGSMVALHFSERQLNSFGDVMKFHDMSVSPPLMAFLFDHGIYLKPRKILRFAISDAHTKSDIDQTVDLIDRFFASSAA
jgi:glutamate-1-semialdehyde 2,1-aminomutase